MRILAPAALIALAAVPASCGSSEPACVPGRTMPCDCAPGSRGLQSCNADGLGYGACGACRPHPTPGPDASFTDVTLDLGLPDRAGPCVGFEDFDGDGRVDLVLGAAIEPGMMGPPKVEVRIYANAGAGHFSKDPVATLATGYGITCAAADLDDDGDVDLLFAVGSKSQASLALYRNDGGFKFALVGDGIDKQTTDERSILALGLVDYDGDGWLDAVVGRQHGVSAMSGSQCHLTADDFTCDVPANPGNPTPLLYKNDHGKFRATPGAFAPPYSGTTNALAFADFDGNGLPDVLLSNDWYSNHLQLQKSPGVFQHGESAAGLNQYNHGMGAAVADYDLDGNLDIYGADLGPNNLWFGIGHGVFENHAKDAGVAAPTRFQSTWAPIGEDFNLDGLTDVFVAASGSVTDEDGLIQMGLNSTVLAPDAQHDLLFWNHGDRAFAPVKLAHRAGQSPTVIAGATAAADFDGDGDLDLAVATGMDMQFRLLRNEQPGGSWLTLRLRGKPSNPHGIGAIVELLKGGAVLATRAVGAQGSLGSSWRRVHFGLGGASSVDAVRVRWPNGQPGGKVQEIAGVKANQELVVSEAP